MLLHRTPYDRSVSLIPPSGIDPEAAVDAGLAVVCQDVRGQYGSDGEFYTFRSEAPDGYDTVEWAAAQPWCDGNVGMVGRSYGATCQWLAAAERPPHLKAICPVVTGSDFYRGWVYQGGAFQLGFNLFWVWMMSDRRGAAKAEELFFHLPLRTVPLPDPKWARFYFDWLAHPTDDAYWRNARDQRALRTDRGARAERRRLVRRVSRRHARELHAHAAARAARELHVQDSGCLLGPWAHGSTYGDFPDHSFHAFRPTDAIDFTERQLRFFARHLRGGVKDDDEAPVTIFVMGENRWRDEDDWPLARAQPTPWYLRAGGALSPAAAGRRSAGRVRLRPARPGADARRPDVAPAENDEGERGAARPAARWKSGADVLVYTSDPLDVRGRGHGAAAGRPACRDRRRRTPTSSRS